MHYGGATQLLSIKCDGNSRISNNGQLFTAATFFWSMPADTPYSDYYYMDLKQTSMATRTPQNKRLNEQNNSVHVRLCIF